jgi:hypothetical protein
LEHLKPVEGEQRFDPQLFENPIGPNSTLLFTDGEMRSLPQDREERVTASSSVQPLLIRLAIALSESFGVSFAPRSASKVDPTSAAIN